MTALGLPPPPATRIRQGRPDRVTFTGSSARRRPAVRAAAGQRLAADRLSHPERYVPRSLPHHEAAYLSPSVNDRPAWDCVAGEDLADGGFPGAGPGYRQVKLDRAAIAAAVTG
jgi:hypothetical protein